MMLYIYIQHLDGYSIYLIFLVFQVSLEHSTSLTLLYGKKFQQCLVFGFFLHI